VTPRATDWGLALLVTAGLATGLGTWFAGSPGSAWVVDAHAIGGTALALLLVVKLRRVWPRVATSARRPPGSGRGLAAVAVVLSILVSGVVWSTAGNIGVAGYSVLVWHGALGAVLGLAVLAHATLRARRPRSRDLARRNFLAGALVAGGALVAWRLQRPLQDLVGLPGARRRFTGSYDAGSFTGNAFPATSWVADRPRPVGDGARLHVVGRVRRPLALAAGALDRGDELEATLDCTGGFYSTQVWRGVRVGRLLERAAPLATARYVSFISVTGYRWSLPLAEAADALLAAYVGGEPISHDHGAPARLVAPGRRGFEWVKWVAHVEVLAERDGGQILSLYTSSFSPAGRGDEPTA